MVSNPEETHWAAASGDIRNTGPGQQSRPPGTSILAGNSVSEPLSALSLEHVPSLSHCSSRLSRARPEPDGSLAGGGQDEYGCSHPQADRGSQEDHGPGSREEACRFGSNQPEGRRSCGSPGQAQQAAYCFQNYSGLSRVKAVIEPPCTGQALPCELRISRLGQSQTRGRPQLSAQGLGLRLQQGQDRQGVLNTGVRYPHSSPEPHGLPSIGRSSRLGRVTLPSTGPCGGGVTRPAGCFLALGSHCPITRGRESSWQSVSGSSFQV